MFSVRGDTVFDPFLGTGTTALAAAASGRNSVGVEIDPGFRTHIENRFANSISDLNRYLEQRLKNHLRFMDKEEASGRLQHTNVHYGFRVKTSQEVRLKPGYLQQCEKTCSNPLTYRASYRETPPAA
jgi:predicted RNA methylase